MRNLFLVCLTIFFASVALSAGCSSTDGADFIFPIESITIDGVEFTFGHDNVLFESVDFLSKLNPSNEYVWMFKANVVTEKGFFSNKRVATWINPSMSYATKYVNELDSHALWFAKTVAADPVTGSSGYSGVDGFICGLEKVVDLVKTQNTKITIKYSDSKKQYNGNLKEFVLKKKNVDDYALVTDKTQGNFGMFFLKKNLSSSEEIAARLGGDLSKVYSDVKIKYIHYSGTGTNRRYQFDGRIWLVDGKPANTIKVSDTDISFTLITRLGKLTGESGYITGLQSILGQLYLSSYNGRAVEGELEVVHVNGTKIYNIYNYGTKYNVNEFSVPEEKSDPDYGFFKRTSQQADVANPSDFPVTRVEYQYRALLNDVVYVYSPSRQWYFANSVRSVITRARLGLTDFIPGAPENSVPDSRILGKSYDVGLNVLINENKSMLGITFKKIAVEQIGLSEKDKEEYAAKASSGTSLYPLERIKVDSLINMTGQNQDKYVYYPPLKRVIEVLPEVPTITAGSGNIVPINELKLECRNGWYSWLFPAKKFRFNTSSPSALAGQGGRWEVEIAGSGWQDIKRAAANTFTELTYPEVLIPLANTLDTADYDVGVNAILSYTSDTTQKCSVEVDQYNANGVLVLADKVINQGEFNSKYFYKDGHIVDRPVEPVADVKLEIIGYLPIELDKAALESNKDTFDSYSKLCHKLTNSTNELVAASSGCAGVNAKGTILFKKSSWQGAEKWLVIMNNVYANNLEDISYSWLVESADGSATSEIKISPDIVAEKKILPRDIVSGACEENDNFVYSSATEGTCVPVGGSP